MGCGASKAAIANSVTVRPYSFVTIHNFSIIKVIGKGGFGKVCIVERKSDHTPFALKYTEKAKASKDRALHYILQERNILEDVHHSYICAMRYSFQDSMFLYMVLDLMPGGDLRYHLKTLKRLDEDAVRFIVAEISLALEYLHSFRIVHRDIKPDNILLDREGHVHLSDFNVAVQYIDGKPLKTIAGTEPYMAPEMLLGLGYFGSVDWWSLGVTMFELVFGERPFRTRQRRDFIKRGRWRFPNDNEVSADCMHAISDFLRMEPTQRLGFGMSGSESLRHHPFFSTTLWDYMQNKCAPPVFVPPEQANNYSTEANIDELAQFLKSPTQSSSILSEQAAPEINAPEFLYYDYTVADINIYRPEIHVNSPDQEIVDHNYTAGIERVNTNFETNNVSFVSHSGISSMQNRSNGRGLRNSYEATTPTNGPNGISGNTSNASLGLSRNLSVNSGDNNSAHGGGITPPMMSHANAGLGSPTSIPGGYFSISLSAGSSGDPLSSLQPRRKANTISSQKSDVMSGKPTFSISTAEQSPGAIGASGPSAVWSIVSPVATSGASSSLKSHNVSTELHDALMRRENQVARRHTFNVPHKKPDRTTSLKSAMNAADGGENEPPDVSDYGNQAEVLLNVQPFDSLQSHRHNQQVTTSRPTSRHNLRVSATILGAVGRTSMAGTTTNAGSGLGSGDMAVIRKRNTTSNHGWQQHANVTPYGGPAISPKTTLLSIQLPIEANAGPAMRLIRPMASANHTRSSTADTEISHTAPNSTTTNVKRAATVISFTPP